MAHWWLIPSGLFLKEIIPLFSKLNTMKHPQKKLLDKPKAMNGCLAAMLMMLIGLQPVIAGEKGAAATQVAPNFTRSEKDYAIPNVQLTRHDSVVAAFPAELDDGRPVILNFLFTTCSAICPMITGLLSGVQAKLGDEIQNVHMVSITIDPEYDRPERLLEYAKKFNAKSQWQFYSGSVKDVEVLQKAFDAYRGDKMNHSATIFLRGAPGKPWVRLDGFPSSDEVIREFRSLK